ncbi:MAG: hypothetical protein WC423_20995 [Vulcanimicrobiota bacterium]
MAKVFCFLLFLTSLTGAQELFTELQARVTPDGPPFTFRVLGDRDGASFSAYGIHVIAPDGAEHMLDQFDSLLPPGSEVDALYVEDINFDGYADLRIMKYLPGGANVPYYFWLYDPSSDTFVEAKEYEVVLSPEVNAQSKELISRQRLSATEFVVDYYRPLGFIPKLLRREERSFNPDGSSVLNLFEMQDESGLQLMETRQLPPEP